MPSRFCGRRQGTDCRNLPGAHALLRAYRALMRIAAPGVLFKAEAIVAPDEIIRYLGTGGYEGKECELAYNATLMCHLWHALASENTQLLRTALTALPPTPETAVWLNYIRCHDDIGWGLDDEDCAAVGQDGPATRRFCSDFYAGRVPGSYAEGYRFQVDRRTGEARTSGTAAALAGLQKALVEANPEAIEAALGRLRLLYGVLYAMRGAPLLYGGDEIGQLNHFAYLDDPLKAMDNRWVHRPPMDWQRAAMRHTPGTVPHRLFATLRQALRGRARKTLLAPLHGRAEEHVLFTENDRLFVVERAFEGERLLVVANFAGRPERLRLGELPAPWQQAGPAGRGGRRRSLLPDLGRPGAAPVRLPAGWCPRSGGPARPARRAERMRVPVETFWGETVHRHRHPRTPSAAGTPGRPTRSTPRTTPVWTAELRGPAGRHLLHASGGSRNAARTWWPGPKKRTG
ncbi:MAG: hypothetical protein KatS3mg043_0496 [Rhodothermaceae bacterium]|nr:MAG: hypothetical protein KatS3mg043_0496 [Rhodothermaceae bacterium]